MSAAIQATRSLFSCAYENNTNICGHVEIREDELDAFKWDFETINRCNVELVPRKSKAKGVADVTFYECDPGNPQRVTPRCFSEYVFTYSVIRDE